MTSELTNIVAQLRHLMSIPSPAATGFDALALELFGFQFDHNKPYRRICEAKGIAPDAIGHWTQIPAVPTAAFKEFELSCLPPTQRNGAFHSSGTTSHQPSRHFHNAESLAVYEASLWPWFRAHLLPDWRLMTDCLQVTILTPPPTQAPRSSLVHMLEVVRRELGLDSRAFVGRVEPDGAWVLGFDNALEVLNGSCNSGKPLMLLGTAFSFVHLVDFLAEQELRFQLPNGSRVMETGGYKGRARSLPKAKLHAHITQRLGVPPSRIVCEYGMSELSSQAYDYTIQPGSQVPPYPCPLPEERENRSQSASEWGSITHPFHFPPWARAQIISPETEREVGNGEAGLIRVFDLANVFSVLAVQTEDLAIRRGEGFELIGRAVDAEPRGCSLLAVNT